MVERMVDFFVSWFVYPGLTWTSLLMGTALALAFGAIWFTLYSTPILKKRWAWMVLVGSALLTVIAVSFIQIPLQYGAGLVLINFWSNEALMGLILLSGLPQILLSGLVQEGSKLVPVVLYWRRKGMNIEPQLGLAIGAVAGLGFGVFESFWAHNQIFSTGWTWELVQAQGLIVLFPFWERFFLVAFHTAACAVAGWGLARGWGWQFYLIAAGMHALLNYSALLRVAGVLSTIQVEVYVAVWTLLVTGAALWLRWRKQPGVPEEGNSEPQPL